ncbi:MAG: apolipoprotein N-acyltransferase [Bacteroidia bacterium]|nr:MAG: apolipoprotein N-acyltransferase [Bacteroidia bacterium]
MSKVKEFFKRLSIAYLSPFLSGILLGISWPYTGSITPLIFVAFVPLLYSHHIIFNKDKTNYLISFLSALTTFFIFNFWTTNWIRYASLEGAYMAITFNAIFMSAIFVAYHFARRHLHYRAALFAFAVFWLAFEWIHHRWELSWPWLTLGNVFAIRPHWIQWYEYTGTLGGSLWILLINITVFNFVRRAIDLRGFIYRIVLFLILPIVISYLLIPKSNEPTADINVLIVQPNIDPYEEKFDLFQSVEATEKFVDIASQKMSDTIDLIVGPETFYPEAYNDDAIRENFEFTHTREFMAKYQPHLALINGLTYYKKYKPGEKHLYSTRSALKPDGSVFYFDIFNSSILLKANGDFQLYHKSKLVLGVEKMPFSGLLPFLNEFAMDLGGVTGSLGYQEHPSLFRWVTRKGDSVNCASIICYESVYGEFVGEFMRLGANLLVIITNDGWWDDSPGYKQHLSFATLRAIETRKDIARCANTGVSAIIRRDGTIEQQSPWWKEATLVAKLNLYEDTTFYAKHGDIIGRLAAFCSVLLLLGTFANKLNITKKRLTKNVNK